MFKLLMLSTMLMLVNVYAEEVEDTQDDEIYVQTEPELVEDHGVSLAHNVLDKGGNTKFTEICYKSIMLLSTLPSDGLHLTAYCEYSDKVAFICKDSTFDVIYGINQKRHAAGCVI